MNLEQTLSFLNKLFATQYKIPLTPLEQEIIRQSWEGKEYKDMKIAGYSSAYIKTNIAPELWKKISEVLGVNVVKKNLQIVMENLPQENFLTQLEKPVEFVKPMKLVNTISVQNWQNVSDLEIFGRDEELEILQRWILQDKSRLVVISGMGGMGKTTLTRNLTKDLAMNQETRFEHIIWLSLENSPTLENILREILDLLAPQQHLALSINNLLDQLRSHRCLIILDGVENLFASDSLAGKYRQGYEQYSNLFKQVSTSEHQSCLLLTSIETPREIGFLAGNNSPVRLLQLQGLAIEPAKAIFINRGLTEAENWETLIKLYRGNPLALKIVATMILELFNGKTGDFLAENTLFIGQIADILDQQFARLSYLEKQLIQCLANIKEPVNFARLYIFFAQNIPKSQIIAVLESLVMRSLIEKNLENGEFLFSLQPVIQKYVQNYYIFE
ncbi:NACHT domain-containing protein [Sphaerospermopsis aphanizomenoides BCCUSP55]|uniref:NB-ARC domain-containing protein n=1 Tax=Sphaerospermopsis aphanizomenoides TaxID=459663 RepID=UPI001907097C|nr:NB-ARC domain-containing protein [Sphaerospermopsis aphanizomenoides]MBK1986193.1 NACHT domain-containing protein [Sphaerospermopsis aphanizomenoides BCCUSP55]